LLGGTNEEVTINDRGNDENECLGFQAVDMIDNTARCAVNEEVPFNKVRQVMMIVPCLMMLVAEMN
jgi:hypothetical protein